MSEDKAKNSQKEEKNNQTEDVKEEKKSNDNIEKASEKKAEKTSKEVKNSEKEEKPAKKKKKSKTKVNQPTIISPYDVKAGMVIRLWQKIKEKTPKGEDKERLQYFEGTVLARRGGSEPGATITIRKISHGVGVEKIFPLALPTIDKIEFLHKIKTRRAKLFYLKRGYKKRLKKIS